MTKPTIQILVQFQNDIQNPEAQWSSSMLQIQIIYQLDGFLPCEYNYSGDLKSDLSKLGLFEGWNSNGLVFKWSCFRYSYSLNHSKTGTFKIWMLLSGFQMVFHKMAAICTNLKW